MSEGKQKSNRYLYPYHWGLTGFYKRWYELPILLAKPYLEKAQLCLDVGCGDGKLTSLLLDCTDAKVVGVDILSKPLRFSRLIVDSPRLSLVQSDTLPFRRDVFDAVVLFDVIEHVPPDGVSAFLAEAHAVMKDGGALIMSTPNRRSLVNSLWGHKMADKHYHEYSVGELRNVVEREGLFEFWDQRGIYLQVIPVRGIEHFAQVEPLRTLFSFFLRLGVKFPRVTEKFMIIWKKR